MADITVRILGRSLSLDTRSYRRQCSFGPVNSDVGGSFRRPAELPDDVLAKLAASVVELSTAGTGSGQNSRDGRERLKRRNSSRRGAAAVLANQEEEGLCRVCMEPVTEAELGNGMALRLGCRCTSGLDALHTECAERWFRIRGSSQCEVCSAEAKNLSEDLKAEFRKISEMRMRQLAARGADAAPGSVQRLLPLDQSSVSPPHEGIHSYILLAAILAFGMFFFYSSYLDLARLPSAFIAGIVAYSTTLPIFAGRQVNPVTHFFLTIWFLACVMAMTALLVKVEGWKPGRASLLSAFVGAVLCMLTVAVVDWVWALRLRWAQRGWPFASSARGSQEASNGVHHVAGFA